MSQVRRRGPLTFAVREGTKPCGKGVSTPSTRWSAITSVFSARIAGCLLTELGRKIDVTLQQVQKYENGTNRVGSGRLFKIASILGVPITAFFEGAHQTATEDAGPSPLARLAEPYVLRLLQAFRALEDMDFRRSLTELAEYMASEALLTPTSSRSRIARRERRDGLTVTSSPRRFPAPWSFRELEQAFVVLDASEQALTYVYFRKDENEARQACVLTHDEARRIAANIAKLPELIGNPAQ